MYLLDNEMETHEDQLKLKRFKFFFQRPVFQKVVNNNEMLSKNLLKHLNNFFSNQDNNIALNLTLLEHLYLSLTL